MKVKTRFAPSPTGCLHVGGARTAIYSWLFARHHDGEFVLRIEDTDFERSTSSAVEAIIDGMSWLNIDWDEGPYFQSKRFDRYNSVIEEMLLNGTAYYCYCSKERINELRSQQILQGKKPHYDGKCRNRYACCIDNDQLSVVRFCNPQSGSVLFNDLIRGPIEFSNHELDDLIIRRADGFPTYNFCVVVDDFDMAITHVIRGEDHINNTPRQINILNAIGARVPEYAHVSMILDSDGKNLSKRYGAKGVMSYRDDGFLPEALLNHLVRLGWAHGDKEVFSLDEMKKFFTLEGVSKSASAFNTNKLLWLNHYYLNNLPSEYIATHLAWYVEKKEIDICAGPSLITVVQLLRGRCNTLKEMAESCSYFYGDFCEFDSDAAKKYLCVSAIPALKSIHTKLSALNNWTTDVVRSVIQTTTEELHVSLGDVCMPLRVAVTGLRRSPALDLTMHAIGRDRCLVRIIKALNYIVAC